MLFMAHDVVAEQSFGYRFPPSSVCKCRMTEELTVLVNPCEKAKSNQPFRDTQSRCGRGVERREKKFVAGKEREKAALSSPHFARRDKQRKHPSQFLPPQLF